MLCILKELSGLLRLQVITTTILLWFGTYRGPYYQPIFTPFTPSYRGTSYELDESQVKKGRHRKTKHKITVSLNEHGPKGNQTLVQKFKVRLKNPLPTLPGLHGISGEQVSKGERGLVENQLSEAMRMTQWEKGNSGEGRVAPQYTSGGAV